MNYRIIEKPIFVKREKYQVYIEQVVDELANNEAVKSIYQLGNVSDPGISDVDMLVIFRKENGLKINPRSSLDKTGKYLFIHSLFGINEALVPDAMQYSLYHNFKYLYGDEDDRLSPNNILNSQLKNQIALEYLVKLYISLTAQKESRLIKWRSFLLEAKAVIFDLQILGKPEGQLNELVKEVIQLRKNWFNQPLNNKEITELFLSFHKALEIALIDLSQKFQLFVREKRDYALSRNITLKKGKFGYDFHRTGFNPIEVIPSSLLRKYFGFLNRTTKYSFYFPLGQIEEGSSLESKYQYESESTHWLNKKAPFFIPLKSPIPLY